MCNEPCDPCYPRDREPLKERAIARVLFEMLRHPRLAEVPVGDALVNTEPAIIHAIRQWFLGRISDAEQEEDLTALISEAEETGHLDIRDELIIGYRVTMSFLHEVCVDVYVENGDDYTYPAGFEDVADWYEDQRNAQGG